VSTAHGSIAVLNGGRIEWARADGYVDGERRIRATPDTLLKAVNQQVCPNLEREPVSYDRRSDQDASPQPSRIP
jgi:hypothetical protein